MRNKIQRPLFLYSCAFITLCALFCIIPLLAKILLFTAALYTVLFLFFVKRINITLLLALLFALTYPFASSLCLNLPEIFATDEVGAVYEGKVLHVQDFGNVQRYTLRIKSTKDDSYPLPIKVYYDSEGLGKGDKIKFFAKIGKNDKDSYSANFFGTRLYAYDVEAIELHPGKITPVSNFRTFAKDAVYSNLPKSQRNESFPLVKAILLGDKQSLSGTVYDSFSKSGISHIFCVSGLHLTLIVSFLFSVLGLFFVPARAKSCICILATLFYMATVGFTPSIVRSGIMMILFLSSHLFARQTDSLTSLGFAGFILCVFSPTSVFDIGAQLSFLATLGLICSSYFSQTFFDFKLHFLPKFILEFLLSTIFATAFCLPCTVFLFGRISLAAYIANLFVIYPATLALLLLLLIVLLSPLSFLSSVSAFFGKCASFLLMLTKNLSDAFLPLPFSSVPANANWVMFTVFFLLLFAIIIILSFNKRKLCAIFMCAVFALNFITVFAFGVSYFSSLYSFDTGIYTDANSTLLCAKDGGAYIICDISFKEQKQNTKCFFYGNNALDFAGNIFDTLYGKNVYFIPISQNLCEDTVISNLKAVQKHSGISLCILSDENENTALARKIRAVLCELNIPYTAQNEFSFGSAVITHEDDGILRVENKDENYVFLYTREYDKRIFEKYENLAGAVYIPRTEEKEYVLFPKVPFFTKKNVRSYLPNGTSNLISQYEYVSLKK